MSTQTSPRGANPLLLGLAPPLPPNWMPWRHNHAPSHSKTHLSGPTNKFMYNWASPVYIPRGATSIISKLSCWDWVSLKLENLQFLPHKFEHGPWGRDTEATRHERYSISSFGPSTPIALLIYAVVCPHPPTYILPIQKDHIKYSTKRDPIACSLSRLYESSLCPHTLVSYCHLGWDGGLPRNHVATNLRSYE